MPNGLDRRDFLKLAGLSGVAGAVGCSGGARPAQELISVVMAAEQNVPGAATWYATTCRECPAGCGMKVRTREGRAVKVEGIPEHPLSRGGLCIRGQASLQGLYNPDRIQGPLRRSSDGSFQAISWEEGHAEVAGRLRSIVQAGRGSSIAFLSGALGPAMESLLQRWLGALGSSRHIVHEPLSHAPLKEAARIAFGTPVVPDYSIAGSDLVLSFGADFLETWLSPVGLSRQFASLREFREGRVGKFVQIEPRLSLTGANADEWIAVRPGGEVHLALGMASYILAEKLGPPLPAAESHALAGMLEGYSVERAAAASDVSGEVIERLAREFAGAQSSVALGGAAAAGENATATELAVLLLNYAAGRVGQTIRMDRPHQVADSAPLAAIRQLIEAMNGGEIEVLMVHSANPVFTLPPSLGFVEALRKVPLVVSFSSFPDETVQLAHLVLPDHSPLEQWGDYRPAAGVHGLEQPAMSPVFDTRATGDVLLTLLREAGAGSDAAFSAESFHQYLRGAWQQQYPQAAEEDFEAFWWEALQRGGVWSEPSRGPAVRLSPSLFDFTFPQPPTPEAGSFALHVYPSSRHYDGRGANRPWLQEIPDPITNIVWDSWVEIHPATAERLRLSEGDVVALESVAGAVEASVYLYGGIRPDTVAMPLGLGHTSYGRYAQGRGSNPLALVPASSDAHSGALALRGVNVQLRPTGRKAPLVRTDGSQTDHGRGFSRIVPLSALLGEAAPPEATQEQHAAEHAAMYPQHEHQDYRWGMAVNLSSCTGCNACVAACYAENNIPVVGKERVAQGRSMAWLRVERYIEGLPPAGASGVPDIRFTPMMCQQCDNAPCEPVCPVFATYHNADGLNIQVYNRCVGTRYCSNNCPYKVRAFNWFDYEFAEPLNLQLNPDVSSRSKGIMEKCTFCVQRVRAGKDRARDERRMVRDGEVLPACAQSCPTQALVFGNLLDPESVVSRMAASQHGYKVLEELNTLPAVTYLPRVKRV